MKAICTRDALYNYIKAIWIKAALYTWKQYVLKQYVIALYNYIKSDMYYTACMNYLDSKPAN